MIVGILFYQISGYEEALATIEFFELWRPVESIGILVVFGQIIRGGILALLLYPFYHIYIKKRYGWLLLFGLLFGLKVLATIIYIPETSAVFIKELPELMTGTPEIMVQTLLFSCLFFIWERRRNNKLSLSSGFYTP